MMNLPCWAMVANKGWEMVKGLVVYSGDQCPQCGSPQHYILNASMPTITMCAVCEHTWNPLNTRYTPKNNLAIEVWENEGGRE
jgi:hypothetical protein